MLEDEGRSDTRSAAVHLSVAAQRIESAAQLMDNSNAALIEFMNQWMNRLEELMKPQVKA